MTKLFSAGDQVPAIPLVEVVGKAINVVPEQMGAICVNVGVTGAKKLTTILFDKVQPLLVVAVRV